MKRMTSFAPAVVVVAALLTGPAAVAQEPQPDPAVSDCPVISVGAIGGSDASASRAFSARSITDLELRIVFRRPLDREHVVTLKVFSPSGFVFRTLDVPVATPAGEAPLGARRLDGYPHPVPVRAAVPETLAGSEYWIADVRMPVAGTTIVTSGLYGRWRIETWLDGAARPCPGSTVFVIKE